MKYTHSKGFYKELGRDATSSLSQFARSKAMSDFPINETHSVVSNLSPIHNSNDSKNRDHWACDYCQVAIFATYEEACEHENACKITKNAQLKRPHEVVEDDGSNGILLATSKDSTSLSDRQCYVRKHFVEIFTATQEDVNKRHSKGAQKLFLGQVGLRCIHCASFPSKAKTERAVCYPSSISRIYQTVADMQRFHFEGCRAIPDEMRSKYRSLKTTRPRGQGSPQAYWITSAKVIGLLDTPTGIRLDKSLMRLKQSSTDPVVDLKKMHLPSSPLMSEKYLSPTVSPPVSPPVPESEGTKASDSDFSDSNSVRDADMLLALRRGTSQ